MRRFFATLLIGLLLFSACAECETLQYGMQGEMVVQLQQALIDKGYLNGEADGIFGAGTESAVRDFQRKNKLKVDGLAGEKTQALLFSEKAIAKSSGFFAGDYSPITAEADKNRIILLQKALIKMNYLTSLADGIYGSMTEKAVLVFQREHNLKADGIVGKQTLLAIETAVRSGDKHISPLDEADPLDSRDGKMKAPSADTIQLLHWYNDIRPNLNGHSKLLVYDPLSGLAWTVKVSSRGRHCDAEPLTIKDTQIMMKAFGNINSWGPKGVYVRLPDGRWTIGATHNVPILKSSISDNGFDGVLCVHFFRDLEECSQLDPNYGMQNQAAIRSLWKTVSGEQLDY